MISRSDNDPVFRQAIKETTPQIRDFINRIMEHINSESPADLLHKCKSIRKSSMNLFLFEEESMSSISDTLSSLSNGDGQEILYDYKEVKQSM